MNAYEPGSEVPGPAPPARIGPYEVQGVLGEGGMGVVYQAYHRVSGERVALKTVRVRARAQVSSMRREIAALQKLRHPGIVRIIDGGVFDGRPWYAMELLSGFTLRQSIGGASTEAATVPLVALARGSVPPPSSSRRTRRAAAGGRLHEVLTLFRLLCAPLAYLHGEGVVHRDIKPENVFVRADGTPLLMDFGMVGRFRGALGRASLEESRTLGGTRVYMAPEQRAGELGDARSDLYALGCTLYEALTGTVPLEHAERAGRFGPLPASEVVLGIPQALDELLLRLLAEDPRDRLGHADDVAAALAALGAADWPHASLPPARPYLYQPRLVGRDDVLSGLLEAVDSSRRLGGLLLIGGESGVGKTTLAAEVARIAYQREYQVVTSQCACPTDDGGDAERAPPLQPFRPLLRHIVEHCLASGSDATDRVAGRWHKLLATIEPAFAALLPSGEQAPVPSLPVQAALERMIGALCDTIVAFAEESAPLLVVVDDLQWADGLSLALLSRLGARESDEAGGRLVVLATYRSDETGTWLASLLELPSTLHVELPRLREDDVGRMVSDMLGGTAPSELVRSIARASEGNPFFVGEYLRTALDAGLLRRETGGHWTKAERSAAGGHYALPETVRALVERRLRGLSNVERALLELAAVLGRELEPELLLKLAERDLERAASETDLAAALRELSARHLLVETPHAMLAFSHDTVRRVAYESIPEASRRSLHAVVARALEAKATETLDGERLAALARHHAKAENHSACVDYLERAGSAALARSAHAEAARAFREALAVAREHRLDVAASRRARWESLIGQAMQGTGQLAESKQHLKRAVELFGFPEPRTRFGLSARAAVQVGAQLARRLVRSENPPGDDANELLAAAQAYESLLQIHYYEAEPTSLVHATFTMLNLAERAGPSPTLASAYANTFAGLALSPSTRGLALSYLERAERVLRATPDPAVESYLALLRGLYFANLGDWAAGEPDVRRSLELAEQLGYRRRWEEALAVLAYNHCLRGDFTGALAEADRVHRSAARGDPQTRCWSLIERAQAKLALGAKDEAYADAREAAALSQKLGRDERIWAGGLLARAELERGDELRAAALADRTLEAIGTALPLVSAAGEGYADVAAVCLELARDRSLQSPARRARLDAARAACRALDAFARAFPLMAPRALLYHGDLASLRGNVEHATKTWSRAAAAAKTASMWPVMESARMRLARAARKPTQSRG